MTKGERAEDLFKEGYNCSQAVFGAFAEELGLDFDLAVKLASPFGGGIGRMREVCGTVSGMALVLGMKYGYDDPKANEAKKQLYAKVQQLAGEFKKENGSIVCRELLRLNEPGADAPAPSRRTEEYYKKRPCAQLCRYAAELTEEFLMSNEK